RALQRRGRSAEAARRRAARIPRHVPARLSRTGPRAAPAAGETFPRAIFRIESGIPSEGTSPESRATYRGGPRRGAARGDQGRGGPPCRIRRALAHPPRRAARGGRDRAPPAPQPVEARSAHLPGSGGAPARRAALVARRRGERLLAGAFRRGVRPVAPALVGGGIRRAERRDLHAVRDLAAR